MISKTLIQNALLALCLIGATTLGGCAQSQTTSTYTYDTTDLVLPKLMGVSLAEYQNSGADTVKNSNWSDWEVKDRPGNPTIAGGARSGTACDFWNRYPEDIQLMKNIGINACRFSLDWSIIEPVQGQFDQKAIQHYHDVIDQMIKNNITPMVTLHHFVHPAWFEQKGAFEKVENIPLFVRFCSEMFKQFNSKVNLWCTINEPGPYAFQGYVNKAFPPGLCDLQKAAQVLKNMLVAHMMVYRTLKSLPGGKQSQIGLVHQYLTTEPYNNWNLIEKIPAWFLTYFFNTVIMRFLKTRKFSFHIPLLANVSISDEEEQSLGLADPKQPLFDFLGLNFYSRVIIQHRYWNVFSAGAVTPSCRPGEVMTDMQYPIYPEGLYNALRDVSQLGVPIYITETGLADAQDNRREAFLKGYIGTVSRAIKEGCDVRGMFYWSLMDNFEWNEGFVPKFGLYEVDFTTKKRTLRKSVLWLQTLLQNRVA